MKRNNTKTTFDRVVVADPDDDDTVTESAEVIESLAKAIDAASSGTSIVDLDKRPSDDECTTADKPEPDAEFIVDSSAALEVAGSDEEPAEGDARIGTRSRRVMRRVLVVSAGLCFVGALGLSACLGWQLRQRDAVSTASRAALDTAKAYAVTLSSIDAKDVDKNFHDVLNGSTGEFKGMYSQSSTQLRQLLIDNKAVSHGVVVQAGVTSATASKVDVILFVDQSISNAVTPDPRLDRLRMVMTMELIDGRWLASHVEVS